MTPPEIGATRPAPPPPPSSPGPLRVARMILDRPGTIDGPGWARCVAWLARETLDDAVSAFWDRRAPAMSRGSGRSQLVALRFAYVDDPGLARHAHQTRATLSDATHHHGYELASTAGELRAWLDAVAQIVERLAAHGSEAVPRAGSRPVGRLHPWTGGFGGPRGRGAVAFVRRRGRPLARRRRCRRPPARMNS